MLRKLPGRNTMASAYTGRNSSREFVIEGMTMPCPTQQRIRSHRWLGTLNEEVLRRLWFLGTQGAVVVAREAMALKPVSFQHRCCKVSQRKKRHLRGEPSQDFVAWKMT